MLSAASHAKPNTTWLKPSGSVSFSLSGASALRWASGMGRTKHWLHSSAFPLVRPCLSYGSEVAAVTSLGSMSGFRIPVDEIGDVASDRKSSSKWLK